MRRSTMARPPQTAHQFLATLPPNSGCPPNSCSQLTKTRFTMSGESAGCPPTSTAAIHGWTMRRKALASLAYSTKGSTRATGYVLPIARDASGTHWQTGAWFLRRERCYLLPGDSPMGMRLPLDSLPWAAPADRPQLHAPDPNQAFAPLPAYAKIRPTAWNVSARIAGLRSGHGRHATTSPHTGSREPQSALSLVTVCSISSCRRPAISRSISSSSPQSKPPLSLLSQPIILEGYEPPRDPRLSNFPGDAGSRCHRGQHSSRLVVGTSSWSEPLTFTVPRACRASPPRNLCSTGTTRARAAAITLS